MLSARMAISVGPASASMPTRERLICITGRPVSAEVSQRLAISTRRFCARPAGVVFEATGLLEPYPRAISQVFAYSSARAWSRLAETPYRQLAGLMEVALKKVQAPWKMHWLEGADHSFHVLKSSGRTDAQVDEEVAAAAEGWLPTLR